METKERISFREKFFYGGGDLASNLVSRCLDGFTDIIMGFIMDKTKSRHGKARPWIYPQVMEDLKKGDSV